MWSMRPPPTGSAAWAAMRSPMARTNRTAGCCGGRRFPAASASAFTCARCVQLIVTLSASAVTPRAGSIIFSSLALSEQLDCVAGACDCSSAERCSHHLTKHNSCASKRPSRALCSQDSKFCCFICHGKCLSNALSPAVLSATSPAGLNNTERTPVAPLSDKVFHKVPGHILQETK